MELISTVWRPGRGAQWVKVGFPLEAFQDAEDGDYPGVWGPGAGAQWVNAAISAGQLVTQDEAYKQEGLRIHVLKVHDGKLTAVWQPGSGAQAIELGLSVDRFVAEDGSNFKNGLRVQTLRVHHEPVVIYQLPLRDASGWPLATGCF